MELKKKLLISIAFVVLIITFILSKSVNAQTNSYKCFPVISASFSDALDNPSEFLPKSGTTSSKAEKSVKAIFSTIYNAGMVISVVMIAVIGLKYMLASAEERANYKEALVPYAIGAVLLFGLTTILKIVTSMANQINDI